MFSKNGVPPGDPWSLPWECRQNCLCLCWKLLMWIQFGLQELWCPQFGFTVLRRALPQRTSWSSSKILIKLTRSCEWAVFPDTPGISRARGGLSIEFLEEMFCIRVRGKLRFNFFVCKGTALWCWGGQRRRHCKYLSADMNADSESCLSQGWDQAGPFELFTPAVLGWKAISRSRDGWAPGKVSGQLVRLCPKV